MINCEKIKELLKRRGMQAQELAAAVGVSASMMTYITKGLREPSVAILVRIAETLECSVDELIKKSK